MKNLLRTLPVFAVAAFLAGCQGPCQSIFPISGPTLTSGTADFTNVAAVGTNFSAGFQSDGLVSRHQVRSFPAAFAQHLGMTLIGEGNVGFTFNGIGGDGIDTLLEIKSLSPLVINRHGRTAGTALNLGQVSDYHHLAVPRQLAADMLDSTYRGPVYSTPPPAGFFSLVYRGRGLGVQQVIRRAPTFITYEFGINEVLGSATSGGALAVFPSANFDGAVRQTLNSIHAALPNTKMAVFNVPVVTRLPFFTTFSPVTADLATGTPLALIGPNGALSPTDLVTLNAKDSLARGTGFPVGSYNYVNPAAPGNGRPLTNVQVLNDAEQATINAAIFNMNASIDSITANRPWTAKVDWNALADGIAAEGYRVGSVLYTTDYVTGGLVSLDGIHPTDLGHAIICNTLIDAVNAQFGATIPHLNLAERATATSSRMRPANGRKLFALPR